MRVRRLAWAIFGVSVALSVAGVALLAQVPEELLVRADNSLLLSALFAAILLVFGLVGALVASRLPANPIGWLFLALALGRWRCPIDHKEERPASSTSSRSTGRWRTSGST